MNKNIISFSVYGRNPRYWKLIKSNIAYAKDLYPDFICRFYIEKRYLVDNEHYLEANNPHIEIILMPDNFGAHGVFWRFLGCIDDSINIFLCRDIDSLLNIRESLAVREWLDSDKDFHIMRDHRRYHNKPIMAGMWGCRNKIMQKIGFDKLLNNWDKKNNYGDDEKFLGEKIYPLIYPYCFEHSSNNIVFKNKVYPFPECDYTGFVGQRK